MCHRFYEGMSLPEIEEAILLDEQKREREEQAIFNAMEGGIIDPKDLDSIMHEQDQILQIALRDIGHSVNTEDAIDVEVEEQYSFGTPLGDDEKDEFKDPDNYRGLELKDYATGRYPSLEEVQKENKPRPAYGYGYHGQYGSWENGVYTPPARREEYTPRCSDKEPWKERFDRDRGHHDPNSRDGVCDDPYAYYSGNWY